MYYEEEMDRSLSKLIADTVRDLLSQYNLTVQEVIRMTIQELAIGATKAVIDKIIDRIRCSLRIELCLDCAASGNRECYNWILCH